MLIGEHAKSRRLIACGSLFLLILLFTLRVLFHLGCLRDAGVRNHVVPSARNYVFSPNFAYLFAFVIFLLYLCIAKNVRPND